MGIGYGYWVLGIGYWVLGIGYWVLGIWYWVRVLGKRDSLKWYLKKYTK